MFLTPAVRFFGARAEGDGCWFADELEAPPAERLGSRPG